MNTGRPAVYELEPASQLSSWLCLLTDEKFPLPPEFVNVPPIEVYVTPPTCSPGTRAVCARTPVTRSRPPVREPASAGVCDPVGVKYRFRSVSTEITPTTPLTEEDLTVKGIF
jgi:hypothetical protein